jgi:hypothetical protein
VGLLCYCDFDFSSLLVEIVGFHVRQDWWRKTWSPSPFFWWGILVSMAVKIRIEPHRRSFRVDTSKGVSSLFWSGTDVVGIQKNASAYFFERSKSSCVALTPPAGGGGKTYVVKGVSIVQ